MKKITQKILVFAYIILLNIFFGIIFWGNFLSWLILDGFIFISWIIVHLASHKLGFKLFSWNLKNNKDLVLVEIESSTSKKNFFDIFVKPIIFSISLTLLIADFVLLEIFPTQESVVTLSVLCFMLIPFSFISISSMLIGNTPFRIYNSKSKKLVSLDEVSSLHRLINDFMGVGVLFVFLLLLFKLRFEYLLVSLIMLMMFITPVSGLLAIFTYDRSIQWLNVKIRNSRLLPFKKFEVK